MPNFTPSSLHLIFQIHTQRDTLLLTHNTPCRLDQCFSTKLILRTNKNFNLVLRTTQKVAYYVINYKEVRGLLNFFCGPFVVHGPPFEKHWSRLLPMVRFVLKIERTLIFLLK